MGYRQEFVVGRGHTGSRSTHMSQEWQPWVFVAGSIAAGQLLRRRQRNRSMMHPITAASVSETPPRDDNSKAVDTPIANGPGNTKGEQGCQAAVDDDKRSRQVLEGLSPPASPFPISTPAIPKSDSSSSADSTSNETTKEAGQRRQTLQDEIKHGRLTVHCIGTVQSIYRLCVGTPRQGLLAPHARGRILLDRLDVQAGLDAVDGLAEYSHVWVVFVFHLNTQKHNKSKKTASKIAPPALGGRKVGVLATRSPHRFNPVGITLVRLDGIRTIRLPNNNNNNQTACCCCLDISGLDLVDGTPVLDIKPYVGTYDKPLSLSSQQDRVPAWVATGLATQRPVYVSDQARRELQNIVRKGQLEFYGHRNESPQEAYENICQCLEEVLSMDVRSAYQTTKARQGKSQAERSLRLQSTPPRKSPLKKQPKSRADDHHSVGVERSSSSFCTQQIDNLLVHFDVRKAVTIQRSSSEGSGAEDHVVVTSVQLMDG